MVLSAFHRPKERAPLATARVRDANARTARSQDPLGTAYELPVRGVLSFAVKSSLWIMCLEGRLWLTTPDARDHVLEPGESLTFERPGKVVIEALRPSNLWVRAESGPPS
jgi:DUF2917 family protein